MRKHCGTECHKKVTESQRNIINVELLNILEKTSSS